MKDKVLIRIKKAFTLAEMLLVILIIGVISAISISISRPKFDETVNIAKISKLASAFEAANVQAVEKYGPPTSWGGAYSKRTKVTEFLDADIIADGADGGFLKGTTNDSASVAVSTCTIRLKSSAVIGFRDNVDDVTIDVDGASGPFEFGKDVFYVPYDPTTGQLLMSPASLTANFTVATIDNVFYNMEIAYNYFRWVMINKNMDYLKLDSSGKCPDGVALNWKTKKSCD